MALEEKTDPTDRIEIVGPFRHVHVRSATWVERDGVPITEKKYHRTVYSPGDESGNADVQAVIDTVHTAEVLQAYQDHLASTDAS